MPALRRLQPRENSTLRAGSRAAGRRDAGAEQTGRSADSPRLRGPRRRRGAPAGTAAFKPRAEGLPPAARKMRLHCEVEVVSRRLPALGLRNPGKGVRALLSLCQQPAPRSPPRPPAGRAGAPRPACLLVSTLKDKRGTRYEVRGAGRPFPGRPTRSRGRAPPQEEGSGRAPAAVLLLISATSSSQESFSSGGE